jgi:hypothetical protein
MPDKDSRWREIFDFLMTGFAGCLVAIVLAVGLFFGICSMLRR